MTKTTTRYVDKQLQEQFIEIYWDEVGEHGAMAVAVLDQKKAVYGDAKHTQENASSDLGTINLYLKDICKSPLLTFAEEQKLAKRIAREPRMCAFG